MTQPVNILPVGPFKSVVNLDTVPIVITAYSDGDGPYNFEITGFFPPGLTTSNLIGVDGFTIIGNCPIIGNYYFTVTATSGDYTGSIDYTWTVRGDELGEIEPFTFPASTLGVPYTQSFSLVSNSLTSYDFEFNLDLIPGSTIPPGLDIVSTGQRSFDFSGTPLEPGYYFFCISAFPGPINQYYSFYVNPDLYLTPNTVPAGAVNTPYTQDVVIAGGFAPYQVSVISGDLPLGLTYTVTADTISFTGVPSIEDRSTITFRVTDSNFSSAVLPIEFVIQPQPNKTITFIPSELPVAYQNVSYNQHIIAGNSTGYVNFTITGGSLPANINMVRSSNQSVNFVGTPTTPTYDNTFVLNAVDSNGQVGSNEYQLPVIATTPADYDIQWITPVGSLGTVPDGVFYRTAVFAYNSVGIPMHYTVIAGTLPFGMQLTDDGVVGGVPKATINTGTGVLDVGYEVTSKFVIRAYFNTSTGIQFRDRTFTFTVSGQQAPYFNTQSSNLGTVLSGTMITPIQISFTDPNPDGVATVRIVAGALPPDLTLNAKTGYISGYCLPFPNGVNDPFTEDFTFIVELSDGFIKELRSFTITVFNIAYLTADDTYITADNTYFTADSSSDARPVLLTPEGVIGTVSNDIFYAYLFTGYTPNKDPYGNYYTLNYIGYNLPPGLVLDNISGWLYGYLPSLGVTSNTYNFQVECYERLNPYASSGPYNYSLIVDGPIEYTIEWVTPSNLGTINNGGTSQFYVLAESPGVTQIYYRLASGYYNNLPQGLALLPNGLISGRVSFNSFSIDNGATTFDVSGGGLGNKVPTPTTFDLTYTFTVNAYTLDGFVNVVKQFSIVVNRKYSEPYENLYIQAMPPEEDRYALSALLNNTTIFDPALIYRLEDPYWGVAKNVDYFHVYGLNATTKLAYLEAMQENHYWKTLTLGEIKTAQAVDDLGNVTYEVVYAQVVDNLLNNAGQSVSKEVVLPYPIELTKTVAISDFTSDGTTVTINFVDPHPGVYPVPPAPYVVGQPVYLEGVNPDIYNDAYTVVSCTLTEVVLSPAPSDEIWLGGGVVTGPNPNPVSTVFPNSLINMRDQIVNTIGTEGEVLPDWMLSRQADGNVLGFTPAWVIAYTKPGASAKIAYNITSTIGDSLNLIDFDVDRYEIDAQLTKNWDPITHQWVPNPPSQVTFDKYYHYQFTTESTPIANPGVGYQVGDRLVILGSSVGGEDGTNDIHIVVCGVNNTGGILTSPLSSVVNWTNLNNQIVVWTNDVSDPVTWVNSEGNGAGAYVTQAFASVTLSGQTFYRVPCENVIGTGSGATFNIIVVPGVQTTFDDNSLQFISPVDQYEPVTNAHDKYVVFPKQTILG